MNGRFSRDQTSWSSPPRLEDRGILHVHTSLPTLPPGARALTHLQTESGPCTPHPPLLCLSALPGLARLPLLCPDRPWKERAVNVIRTKFLRVL